MGRILLAFWDKKAADAYLTRTKLRAHTPRTVTDVARLRAILAKVDQTISVQGKLEPVSGVRAVQAPLGGVVSRVLVREGESVTPGELLVEFDTRDAESQLLSLGQIRRVGDLHDLLFRVIPKEPRG